VSSLGGWLVELGLEQYAEVFEQEEVTLDDLPHLSSADLKELGLPLGPRNRILRAAAAISAGEPVSVPVAAEPVQAPEKPAPAPAAAPVSASAKPPNESAPQGERRQLTVMFCDMVGFTALASRVDPEVLQKIIRIYEDGCAAAITRYDGYVFQRLGDGIVAFFGYPLAHENEAERAIRAGLDIIDAFADMDVTEVGHLEVRIGIATGLVVVASAEKGAVGETMNLASRLQGIAQVDTIVVSERVKRLAGRGFEYEDLGAQNLKGISQPTNAFGISGVSDAASRFDAAQGQSELTALVGRDQEIGLLMERWQLAQDGEGQVVLLSGEPGIGKSRILSSLRENLEAEGAKPMRFQCSPYYVNSAFWPSIENFERTLKFSRDESPESKLDKLEALIVGQYGRPQSDVRFIANMLSIPCDARYGKSALAPQKFKDETLRTLVDITEAVAKNQPTLLLFEDAHLADPTSLEVLDLLVDRMRTVPLLIVITHRPEFQSRWSDHGHVVSLNLSKLTRAQSTALVSRVTGGKALPDDLLEQILLKTDGVPLFAEELTKSILESGELIDAGNHYDYAGSARSVTIPATLRDSLMARLDRYMPVKEIAQIGAAIGRDFSYELIAAVAPLSQSQLDSALGQFTDSGLVFRRGTPPEAVYTFKHALLRDAAYESLLKSRRQELHGKIANILDERFPETRDTEPEVLAHHYTQAELPDVAAALWLRAGQLASARSANQEAVSHLQNGLAIVRKMSEHNAVSHLQGGLEIVEKMPEHATRSHMEIALNLALGPALIGNKGMVETVVLAFERARELSEKVDSPDERFRATWGLWHFNNVRGAYNKAIDLADELMGISGEQQETGHLLQAHHASWTTKLAMGKVGEAREHSAHGRDVYDVEAHQAHRMEYGGHDPGVCSRVFSGLSLWLLGYPDQAAASADDAVELARRLEHPMSLAQSLTYGNWVYILRRDADKAGRNADEAIRVATENGVAMFIGRSQIARGWTAAQRGETETGVADIHEGLVACGQTGSRMGETWYMLLLAEIHLAAGQIDKAKASIAQARDIVATISERWLEADICRMEGDINASLSPEHAADAETCYVNAIEIAQASQAKSLELRAASSLARLWKNNDRRKEAHDLLAPVYDWFTEGFETSDLKTAAALLKELRV
jgi:class 3 adenylate cyclase/predicted ATPase